MEIIPFPVDFFHSAKISALICVGCQWKTSFFGAVPLADFLCAGKAARSTVFFDLIGLEEVVRAIYKGMLLLPIFSDDL